MACFVSSLSPYQFLSLIICSKAVLRCSWSARFLFRTWIIFSWGTGSFSPAARSSSLLGRATSLGSRLVWVTFSVIAVPMSFTADFWDPWPHLAVSSYRSGKSLFLFIIYRSPSLRLCTYRTPSSPLPCRTSWIACWAPSSNAHSPVFIPRIPVWQSEVVVKEASFSGFLGR